MSNPRCGVKCILPPYLLRALLESSDIEIRQAALNALLASASIRGRRAALAGVAGIPADGRRTIYDARHRETRTGATIVRTEDGRPSPDKSVNNAFEGLGTTRKFYADVFHRNSIDDHGMRLNAYVHWGQDFPNAFWDGRVMVFGDGDGGVFSDLTGSLDVIGHELTHGVTEHTARLEYYGQPGALNESISDVGGSMIKQWALKQTVTEADWLIGAEVFTPEITADALRSMKAPGTAYDNSLLGKDPQPDHMDRYVDESEDNGGVHLNSGIPNKAFFLAATAIGGFSWEGAGPIWYEAMKTSTSTTDFSEFAAQTYTQAGCLFGQAEKHAVAEAWDQVGVVGAG